jgi:hypothetical protein
MARRKLMTGRVQLWGHQIAVDWAEPEAEVDEDIMSQVRGGTRGRWENIYYEGEIS